MTTYERGDVVNVPIRFTQRDRAKSRPAVVISSAAFNASRRDVIVAGITGNISRHDFVGQLVLDDWTQSGLRKPSAVSGIVQTIRGEQIRERMGVLSANDKARLDIVLREVLGL